MILVLASNNKNKKKEIRALLKGARVSVRASAEVLDKAPKIVESGKTFEENAEKKALVISRLCGKAVIADDSGLSVDALGGAPGVKSARFAGSGHDDEKNNSKLLRLLKDTPKKDRKACFLCAISLAYEGRIIKTVVGRCRGSIGYEPRGKNGFGYDPLFIPSGFSKTFAQLGEHAKNKISHRGKALRKAKGVILKYLSK